MSKAGAAFPGFDSPGVGFEQPFEMLEACHERVQRSLDLLARLIEHIDRKGHDAQSRSAAMDVLRYFDLAAPLHHQDEETNVFPLLLAHGDAAIHQAVNRLQHDHKRMERLWAAVREPLSRWSQPGALEEVSQQARADIEAFCGIYGGHIETEEGLVFPAARSQMADADLATMGQAMQARRQSA
jgi:hemerythrin-like domain-containing protein